MIHDGFNESLACKARWSAHERILRTGHNSNISGGDESVGIIHKEAMMGIWWAR
jgi:hypothetical protein